MGYVRHVFPNVHLQGWGLCMGASLRRCYFSPLWFRFLCCGGCGGYVCKRWAPVVGVCTQPLTHVLAAWVVREYLGGLLLDFWALGGRPRWAAGLCGRPGAERPEARTRDPRQSCSLLHWVRPYARSPLQASVSQFLQRELLWAEKDMSPRAQRHGGKRSGCGERGSKPEPPGKEVWLRAPARRKGFLCRI